MNSFKADLGLETTGLSVRVLDAGLGAPAAGLMITVTGPDGITVSGKTDAQGCARVPGNVPSGPMAVTLNTGQWFAAQGRATGHPEVEVRLTITSGRQHQVLIALSPFGYTVSLGA